MINAWLVMDPVFSFPLSAMILICLTVFLIWMECRRPLPYLTLRLVASLLIIMSFAGFLFRPLFKTRNSEQVILLTPDYNMSQVDSLLRLYPAMKVLQTPDAKQHPDAVILDTYNDLSGREDNISFVAGQGLPPDAMDLFKSHPYQFIPSPYPDGIIRISIPERVLPNRRTVLEGIYNSPSKDLKLFLIGPGGKEDSVTFTKDGFQHFELSFLPKTPGNFVYTIESAHGLAGRLPVRVQKQKALNILFVQHHPSFETRYLKNFLGRYHRLVLRYQLSKNRYRHEFVNHEPRNVNRLTNELLSEFDLLIIDTDALQGLRASEIESLQSAISEGLGVLALFNSSPAGFKDIIPFRFTRYARDTAHVSPGGNKLILPAWSLSVRQDDGIIAVSENRNRILSGYRYQGMGKMGFQLIQETYRLVLQGDSVDYSALWSRLVEDISRADHAEFVIHQKTKFPLFAGLPIHVEIISLGKEPTLSLDEITLPLKENVLINDLWDGELRAGKEGWNRLTTTEGQPLDLYVSDPAEWKSVAITNVSDATRKAASSATAEQQLKTVFRAVPQWIFYFVFLLAAGFLWLVPKF